MKNIKKTISLLLSIILVLNIFMSKFSRNTMRVAGA